MIPDITVIHAINGVAFDVTHMVIDAKISGRNSTPSRSLQVTFSDVIGKARAGQVEIDPMRGDQVTFIYNHLEIFRGLWMKTQRGDSQTQKATAYDMGIYLSNNKDTFCYEDPMSASDAFRDVCSRFGIPMGTVADTGYKIDGVTKSKTTGWDVIGDLLEQTYEATGRRFAVYSQYGKLNLVERENNLRQWVIETGVNLHGYDKSLSTEKIKTRVKVYSREDTVVAEASNSALESKIGVFQDIASATDDDLEEGKAQEIANTSLQNSCKPDESMSVTATGIPDVITGTGIYVRISTMNDFESVCYVEEDTHNWRGEEYTMDLKIRPA